MLSEIEVQVFGTSLAVLCCFVCPIACKRQGTWTLKFNNDNRGWLVSRAAGGRCQKLWASDYLKAEVKVRKPLVTCVMHHARM